MANLTLTVDEDTLLRARVKALEQGTSVNAVVRDYLDRFAGASPAHAGLAAFLEGARASSAGSGTGGRSWTREGVHER
ncbi:MAG: hypothetical protein ACR2NV_06550 [Thermoleophilaceae bacterium]|jgi:hypothetical protein